MFYVIQKTFDVKGSQLDSDSIKECDTEQQANEFIELQEKMGLELPDDNGVYCRFHVEAI